MGMMQHVSVMFRKMDKISPIAAHARLRSVTVHQPGQVDLRFQGIGQTNGSIGRIKESKLTGPN